MPADIKALEAGARVEAQWDGREFDTLGRADKARYVERFAAAIASYEAARETGWALGLEQQFRPMAGYDKNQPGYQYREGWNAAIRHVMDLQRIALAPLPEQEPRP